MEQSKQTDYNPSDLDTLRLLWQELRHEEREGIKMLVENNLAELTEAINAK